MSRAPHSVLFELLYAPHFEHDRRHVLPFLLRIDAAHIAMLAEQEILSRETAAALLGAHRDLRRRLSRGEDVLTPPPSHRGLYLLYEQHYVRCLGEARGGAAHVGRSRNDINATVPRMRLREELLELGGEGDRLLAATLDLAAREAETLMSAFTHLQPAQPSTLGHYLAAVADELLRSLEALAEAFTSVDRCPMGAAAGIGTSFAVDRELVADLLGFDGVVGNSLDAVASRDYVVRVLAAAAGLGSTLTRWAQDFQLWGNYAHGFLSWPDDLVSTSSIMPQKRNAYVWENVRGQAVHPAGALVDTLMGMKNTPFSNSVEVSGEATSHLWPALAAITKAVRLTRLLIENVEVERSRMRRFLDGAETTMTALADQLVKRQGLAFRTAHEVVGQLVARCRNEQAASSPAGLRALLGEILEQNVGESLVLDEEEVGRALDPVEVLRAARFGGGPAPDSVRRQLAVLDDRRARLLERLTSRRARLEEAERRLWARCDQLCGEPAGDHSDDQGGIGS